MEVANGLKVQSLSWLLNLEYDTVTFGADLKAKYKIWLVIED